ncbi:hypothetical protein V5O48_014585 [Marasmius crinis-equi]|uniref:BZIP domain-containing protein n=1 Tax=Marasmius crinis-equi TaxID=585013 RepID=A0ABR3EWX2_9AGAR
MDSASIQTPSSISTPSNNRRRKYENETPSQRIKREKAAERQRRKRERDRNALHALTAQVNQKDFQQQHQQVDHNQGLSSSSQVQQGEYSEDLTPEEAARRERVRAAARERQRKHRALVKQRKMRELGVDMGNQVVPNLDGLQYPDQPYGISPSEMHQGPPNSVDPQTGEPAFPRIQGHGGQMFATTLLLSFSCAPLLKQHLLDTLQMSNDELASLEPIIAEAWDQWDRQRRQFDPQHFEQNASSASSTATTTNSTTSTSTSAPPSFPHLGPGASSSETAAAAIAAVVTPDFRARFHRSIVAPTPFQAQAAAAAAQAGVGTGSPAPVIDPHLNEKDEA